MICPKSNNRKLILIFFENFAYTLLINSLLGKGMVMPAFLSAVKIRFLSSDLKLKVLYDVLGS